MAPAFSEGERDRVRETLLETGRRLFTTQGLRKTSLDDLTQPAGIHKTSFYSFFESKEELYLELLLLEQPRVEARVAEALHAHDHPREALHLFLQTIVNELETNALIRRLITHPEELEMVAARVRPQDTAARATALLPIRSFVEQWQRAGRITEAPADIVIGVIRAVTLLTLHRQVLGEDIYPQVLNLIITIVADGLTRPQTDSASATGVSNSSTSA